MTDRLPKQILLDLLKKYEEDLKKFEIGNERQKIELKISFIKKKLREYNEK